MNETVLAEWVKALSSGKRYTNTSCDFGELIWSEEVTQQQQIKLLQTEDAFVRRAVAWAIADLSRDGDALRYLINECFNDVDARVRRYSWLAICQAPYLSFDQKQQLVEDLGEEHDEVVLALSDEVRATIRDRHGSA